MSIFNLLSEKSLVVEYWKFIFPALVGFYILIFLYDKHRYQRNRPKQAQPEKSPVKKEKLDGMEYVGGEQI